VWRVNCLRAFNNDVSAKSKQCPLSVLSLVSAGSVGAAKLLRIEDRDGVSTTYPQESDVYGMQKRWPAMHRQRRPDISFAKRCHHARGALRSTVMAWTRARASLSSGRLRRTSSRISDATASPPHPFSMSNGRLRSAGAGATTLRRASGVRRRPDDSKARAHRSRSK
jgi:hypothetical protein